MRKIFLVFSFILVTIQVYGLGFSDLQGTWRSGERGYTRISYICAGSQKIMPYTIELTFATQTKSDELTGTGSFEFERFNFKAKIEKGNTIKVSGKLQYSNRVKTIDLNLKKNKDRLEGRISEVINCGKGIKASIYSNEIFFLQKAVNTLNLSLVSKFSAGSNPEVVKFLNGDSVVYGTVYGSIGFVNFKSQMQTKEILIQAMRTITDLAVSTKKSKIFITSYNGLNSVTFDSNKEDYGVKADRYFKPDSQAGLVPFRIDALGLSNDENDLIISASGGVILSTDTLFEKSRVTKNQSGSLTSL